MTTCYSVSNCCNALTTAYDDAFVEVWHVGNTGSQDAAAQSVSDFLDSKDVSAVILGGDCDQNDPHDYAASVGGYYSDWYGREALFPVPGEYDWDVDNLTDYLTYFEYLNDRRYYTRRLGPIQFFFLSSGYDSLGNVVEPDGNDGTSTQNEWLAARIAETYAPWKVAVLHVSPLCSDSTHGSNTTMQDLLDVSGLDAVISSHSSVYERLQVGDTTYIVNGLGGQTIHNFTTPLTSSQFRYNSMRGALKIRGTANELKFSFYNKNGALVDSKTLVK
jgi:hypothetical protein